MFVEIFRVIGRKEWCSDDNIALDVLYPLVFRNFPRDRVLCPFAHYRSPKVHLPEGKFDGEIKYIFRVFFNFAD